MFDFIVHGDGLFYIESFSELLQIACQHFLPVGGDENLELVRGFQLSDHTHSDHTQ